MNFMCLLFVKACPTYVQKVPIIGLEIIVKKINGGKVAKKQKNPMYELNNQKSAFFTSETNCRQKVGTQKCKLIHSCILDNIKLISVVLFLINIYVTNIKLLKM